jgi:hypothetical protein
MSSFVDGIQNFVGQVPDVLQPLVIAAAGAVPYVEGEGAAVIGVLGGLNPVVAALAAAAGNLICVVLVVLLGARIRTAVVARRARRVTPARAPVPVGATSSPAAGTITAEREAAPESKGRRRLRRWLVRFGVPGASLLAPLALPTPFTAATFVAAGVGKGWVILWQAVAIAVWTTGVTVAAVLFATVVA